MCSLPRPRRGFSLIELLTAIAIIAVLVTLAFVTVLNVTERARQSKSIANLRTLGDAFYMYSVDNNGLYPPRPRRVPDPEVEKLGWISGSLNRENLSIRDGALYEYVRDEEAYVSPSQVHAYPEIDVFLSYAIQRRVYEGTGNHKLWVPQEAGGRLEYPNPRGVISPATKIFMVEQINADDGLYHELGDRAEVTGEIVRGRDALFWHNNVSNFLFYDLHVETLEYDDPRADPLNHPAWRPGESNAVD